MPAAPRSPASAATAVYIGIVASTVIISAGAIVVSQSLHTGGTGFSLVDAIGLFVGLGPLAFAGFRRATLPPRGSQTADAWWQTNMGTCLVLWSVGEMPAVIGAILLFLGGHTAAGGILIALALAALTLLSPGRLSRA